MICLFMLFRYATRLDCSLFRYYVCESAPQIAPATYHCPKDFVPYKDKCYYPKRGKFSYQEAQEMCALKGSIITPLKDHDTLRFFRAWGAIAISGDFWLGLKQTKGEMQISTTDAGRYNFSNIIIKGYFFSDGEQFNTSIHLEQLEMTRVKGFCFGLKAAVDYEIRELQCDQRISVICQWKGKPLDIVLTSDYYDNALSFFITWLCQNSNPITAIEAKT